MKKKVKSLEDNTIGMTNYFFEMPRTSFIFLYLIIFPILIAFVHLLFIQSASQTLSNSPLSIMEYYLYILLGSTFVMVLLAKIAKPSARIRYLILISAISETIYGIFLLLSNMFVNTASIFMYIGVGLSIMLWYITSRIIFSIKWRAILYAVLQSFLFIFFLLSPGIWGIPSFSKAYITYDAYLIVSIIFLISVYLFLVILNAPAKRNFGLGIMDALMSFTSQWLYGDNDLEEILDSIGKKCNTLVSVLSFRQQNGKHIHKYHLVIPNIHYGPFGTLGSSAFTCDIKKLNDSSNSYIAFHGAATHDLNLTTSRESRRIIRKIEGMSSKLSYSTSKIKYLKGAYHDAICDGLIMGKNAIISFSRYPKTTEDISFGAGLSLMNLGKSAGYDTVVIDEHNAETGNVDRFYPGDVEFYEYYKAADDFFSKIKKSKSNVSPLTLGYYHFDYNDNSMGCAGINILVLASKYILIIFDSNGMDINFKSKLEKSIKKKYKLPAIIYTTDTHSSNKIKGTLNPIKYAPELENQILSGISKALSKQRPAKVAYTSEWTTIKALGPQQSTEIITTLNASFAILKILTPLFVILMIAIVLLISLHI